ncbi:MAG: calcium-binding protein [Thermoleophilaceae bacterium]
MRHRIRALTGLALAGIAYFGAVGPSTGHPADPATGVTSHFVCRASAGFVNLAGTQPQKSSGHIEPVVANGDPVTGFDRDFCANDDDGFPNMTLPPGGGSSGSATANEPFAKTTINPDFTYKQTASGEGRVQQVILQGPPGSLEADAVVAKASLGCKNGVPTLLSSEANVLNLKSNGTPQGPDNGQQQMIVDQPNFKVVKDEQFNFDIKDPKTNAVIGHEWVVRGLHVYMANDPENYAEFVIGETRVGYHGTATELCSPPPARCPEGANYDASRGVCVITVTQQQQAPCPDGSTRDTSGACIVVVGPPSTQPGTGGNVVPLQNVAGLRKTSPCRNKRFGRQVGIVGTNRGDRITGSNRSDRIFVFGGNDRVSGGRGNDCIEGGLGSDQLDGSNGTDWLIGGAGNDQLSGGQRNDYIYGGQGNDKIIGGTGNDHLYGGPGRNKIDGGKGNDVMVGGSDRDYITAGNGRDVVRGGKGNDTINAATAGPPAKVDCGPGVDTVRINNNEIHKIKHCERVFVTTRLKRFLGQLKGTG